MFIVFLSVLDTYLDILKFAGNMSQIVKAGWLERQSNISAK